MIDKNSCIRGVYKKSETVLKSTELKNGTSQKKSSNSQSHFSHNYLLA